MRLQRIVGLAIVTLILATLSGIGSARAQTPDTQAVAAAYKQAFAAGDLDATFALFSDQFAANDPLTGPYNNKTDYRHAVEAAFAANPNASIVFGESTFALDTAIHYVTLTSDPIKALGISRIRLIQTLVIFQGKVIGLTGALDLSDPETATFAAATVGR